MRHLNLIDVSKQKCGADILEQNLLEEIFEATSGLDGPQAFDELIEAFLVIAAGRIAAIRSAIACDDAEALFRAAHSLNGSSGSYGAQVLAALARQIEALGRAGDVRAAGLLIEQLEVEFERVKRAFSVMRQSEGN